MARKNKHSYQSIQKKRKTKSDVSSRPVQALPASSNVVPLAPVKTAPKLAPDYGEVVLSDKYGDLPYEMRRVGIVTAIVVVVLLILWLIFR